MDISLFDYGAGRLAGVEHAIQSGKVGRLIAAVRMTKREQDVIALIAEGRSNKEIAAQLHIAVHTVKSHVHHILEKLALHTRLELASLALTGGMAKRNPGGGAERHQ